MNHPTSKPTKTPTSTSTSTPSRALTNKRRHRARQKEYVLSLERIVSDFRSQGVHATKEVQIAAQRVVRENARLRELLRRTGVRDADVDAWVKGEDGDGSSGGWGCGHGYGCSRGFEGGGWRGESVVETPAQAQAQVQARALIPGPGSASEHYVPQPQLQRSAPPESQRASASGPTSVEPRTQPAPPSTSSTSTDTHRIPPSKTPLPKANAFSNPPSPPPPPCKLLTHLTLNPSQDLTQIPMPPASPTSTTTPPSPHNPSHPSNERQEQQDTSTDDGIPCAEAYKLLIPYATSDARMDKIAAALESGCTPCSGGGGEGKGRCKVKKEVVWRVLDEECM